MKMLVAGSFYEQGRLSAGQAAAVAGVSKRTFLELLGKYGFTVLGYGPKELVDDLQSLQVWGKL